MRIFYDTNVLLSVMAFPGRVSTFHASLAGHTLITSERAVGELNRIVDRKLRPRFPDRADAIVARVRIEWQIMASVNAPPSVATRDPADDGILADAEASGADVLLTGDRDLLDIAAEVQTLRIMSPTELERSLS